MLDPLPYTGAYDDMGCRRVNHEREKAAWDQLPFMTRLARSRIPWCIVDKAGGTTGMGK